jgi:tetratricopeptide (TPR) repeat protein
MKALRARFSVRLLIGFAIGIPASEATAQTPSAKTAQPEASAQRKLSGDDLKRAAELNRSIEAALKADRWDEAIARAEELLAVRARVRGLKHFETVNDEWRLKALRRVAALPKDERVAFQSARTLSKQADVLYFQGKYAAAQPLYEKALQIYRRLLTDVHPLTAGAYADLAVNLAAQGKHNLAQPLQEKALGIRSRLLSELHPDKANSYTGLAHILQAQGHYAQAQALNEKALEIDRRLLGDVHLDTATSYNNLAVNLGVQGKYAQAQPLFEKALEIFRRLVTDEHPLTAQAYNNIAYNLRAQGKYAQAQPLFENALELRRRLLTDSHPDTAKSYENLAGNMDAQGKHSAAQPLHEKGLEINRRLLGEGHPDTASSYNGLAMNLGAQGKHRAAQPLYEKALDLRRRLFTDDHPDTAGSYNNLAVNLNAQGRYADAQPLYERALEINRRLLTDQHPSTALNYNNVAYNLDAQGKHAEAQPLFEKALEIRRRLLTELHPDTAQSYNNVAYNLDSQGKYAAAQPLYEKGLEIKRRLLSDLHPDTALSYNNVAYNLYAQGKYGAAQPLFEKALDIRRQLLADRHPDTAQSYNNLASNLNAQGNYAQARALYEKALEITLTVFGEGHAKSARCYHNLAFNLYTQGRYHEAEAQWRHAVQSLDLARVQIAFSGMERAATEVSVRSALSALLARLGRPAEAWQSLEEGFGRGLLDEFASRQDRRLSADERNRLRELTSEVERLDRLFEANPSALGQTERAKRFEELKRQRDQAGIALSEFQTKLVRAHGTLAGRVATLAEIQSALPGDTALVAWVEIRPAGLNAADPDGDHWGVVVRSRGVPAWIAIAGTGKDGHWTTEDTALAGRVRTTLRGRPDTGAMELRSLLDSLHTQLLGPLAKALGATGDGLPAARRLIVLPSRDMAGIPLEALLVPDDSRIVSYAPSATVLNYLREQPRPDRHAGLLALGDPVFEQTDPPSKPSPLPDRGLVINVVAPGSNAARHGLKVGDVLMAYNGVALTHKDDLKIVADGEKPIAVDVWREGRSSPRELAPGKLGVVIDPRPARQAIAENRKLQDALLAARGGSNEFSSLPGTRHEVEALGELFKADDRPTRILLGTDASEPELDRIASLGELQRYGFVHLAAHGVIDEGVPARSAVILTQTGLPDPLEQALNHKPVFDGRLSVREIQRGWDLKAELVTLSACETALGREAGGEGFVGFTQALLMSGARSVCLSLWKVDDTATALLMQRFYANLLGRRTGLTAPLPKAEALHEAKAWLRALPRADVLKIAAELSGGIERSKGTKSRRPGELKASVPVGGDDDRPYSSPHFWAAFVLSGDPD